RLLVLGGSQVARQINSLVPAALARLAAAGLADPGRLKVLHQAGAKNVAETAEAYRAAGVSRSLVEIVPFLEDVAAEMAASHLLISRAGAITAAEICAAGRPALFLPLAIAQGHQVENAELLAAAGAAELLVGDGATAEALADRLKNLLGNGERLAEMGRAARRLAKPGAVAAIADELTYLAQRRGRR
ncbi:MAG TPA: glycosyltransferase, partial [Thermoanaerobaculia bacterium]|nr:glycosyltransferase [Thermoanaerobaculia bacterium]